jgi:hypothetical protein
MNWIEKVNALITLQDTPDERILALVPWGIMDAKIRLGEETAAELENSEDEQWAGAVTHFIASRLMLSSRELIMGIGFPDSNAFGTSWGNGETKPASVNHILELGNHFRELGNQICEDILRRKREESEDTVRWYDI